MDRDTEILLSRATSLATCVVGQLAEANGKRQTRVGGSGVLIAPYLALTAKHVMEDLRRLYPWPPGKPKPGTLSDHGALFFQGVYSSSERRLWTASSEWAVPWTDLSLIQVAFNREASILDELDALPFFPWAVLPPPVGAEVQMLGYPQSAAEPTAQDGIHLTLRGVLQRARVVNVHPLCRDRGMFTFPCFELDRPVGGGFSGGPVFWDGHLCGVVSGGHETTYVASLWPICLMDYGYPGLSGLKPFSEFLDRGAIQSRDWETAKTRISKRVDEAGRKYAFIEPLASPT